MFTINDTKPIGAESYVNTEVILSMIIGLLIEHNRDRKIVMGDNPVIKYHYHYYYHLLTGDSEYFRKSL